MSAPHFLAPAVSGARIAIAGEDARHAARVLRIAPGERITASDGCGAWVEARVEQVGTEVVAAVLERRAVAPPRPWLVVWQAIPKAGKLDVVVQKLTEIGAGAVVPFAARRSVARWDGEKSAARTAHLQAVAREACKQSRRAWLLEVSPPRGLAEARMPCIVLHEEAPLRLSAALSPEAPETLSLVVGPEGGLAPEEVAALEARGAVVAGLGPQVLRTETAALVAAAVILSRYGVIG